MIRKGQVQCGSTKGLSTLGRAASLNHQDPTAGGQGASAPPEEAVQRDVLGPYDANLISCCVCLMSAPPEQLFLHAVSRESSAINMCTAIICGDCMYRISQNAGHDDPKCPVCKEYIVCNQDGLYDRHYQKLLAQSLENRNPMVVCSGCEEDVPYAEYSEHLQSCERAQIPCPIGCWKKYSFGKLRAHSRLCEARVRCKCPRCDCCVPQIRMEEHIRAEHGLTHETLVTTSEFVPVGMNGEYNVLYNLKGIRFCAALKTDYRDIEAVVACYGNFPTDPDSYRVTLTLQYESPPGTKTIMKTTSPIRNCYGSSVAQRYLALRGGSPSHDVGAPYCEMSLTLDRVGLPEQPQSPSEVDLS